MQVQELKHLGNEVNKYTEQKQGTQSEKRMLAYGNVEVHKTSILDEWGKCFSLQKCITATQLPFGKNNATSVPLFLCH